MELPERITTPERTIVDFHKYGLDDLYRLGKYAYKTARNQLEEHVHEGMMEICYCDTGVQVYEVDGKIHRIKGGDVFVTFPGEPHSSAKYPEEKGSLYWLIVRLPDKGSFLHYNEADSLALVNALRSLPARHFKGNAILKKSLDEMLLLHQVPLQPIHRLSMIHLVTGFLLQVIQAAAKANQAAESNRVLLIKQYIAENLYNTLTIEMLAKWLHLSEAHFKSWFKKETGMPPLDYIVRERIEEAKKMLAQNKEIAIADIAYQLNFSSSQYFATVFRKYTGCSPAAFRNQLKEAP